MQELSPLSFNLHVGDHRIDHRHRYTWSSSYYLKSGREPNRPGGEISVLPYDESCPATGQCNTQKCQSKNLRSTDSVVTSLDRRSFSELGPKDLPVSNQTIRNGESETCRDCSSTLYEANGPLSLPAIASSISCIARM